MATILIADDDDAVRDGIAEALSDLGHRVAEATNGEEAISWVARQRPDAVLLDLRMPGRFDGLATLKQLRCARDAPPIAILTAYASAANTIEAMRSGAFDHLTKPVGRTELADLIARMLRAPEAAVPATERWRQDDDDLVGASADMRMIQKTIGLVADGDATVLITGETGTGKEVVARALHRFGRRAAGPFVAVNCAAIPSELLESELFGHVRGAFTGAIADRRGAFRDAAGGTLFLDEIGDMGLSTQAKILRVVQEREVTPLGGKAVRVDVRIVAATHRDLAARVREGSFREDLYYRLAVVPIHLTPLRERPADIIPLAEHFLAGLPGSKRLGAEAAARLLTHSWPGNARELRNAMERAAALNHSPVIGIAELGRLGAAAPSATPSEDWMADDLAGALTKVERAMIDKALRESGGNRAEAARRLGIHRQLLYTKIRQHGLDDASDDTTRGVRNSDGPKR